MDRGPLDPWTRRREALSSVPVSGPFVPKPSQSPVVEVNRALRTIARVDDAGVNSDADDERNQCGRGPGPRRPAAKPEDARDQQGERDPDGTEACMPAFLVRHGRQTGQPRLFVLRLHRSECTLLGWR